MSVRLVTLYVILTLSALILLTLIIVFAKMDLMVMENRVHKKIQMNAKMGHINVTHQLVLVLTMWAAIVVNVLKIMSKLIVKDSQHKSELFFKVIDNIIFKYQFGKSHDFFRTGIDNLSAYEKRKSI